MLAVMAESLIVDASVVAKWFNEGESHEREALALQSAWISGRIQLHSPSLVTYEVCNSIWKNPNIDDEKAESLSKLAIRLKPNLIFVEERESSETMSLARKRKITVYDAIYIVLSKFRRCPLISADENQLRVAKGYTKAIHIREVLNII